MEFLKKLNDAGLLEYDIKHQCFYIVDAGTGWIYFDQRGNVVDVLY